MHYDNSVLLINLLFLQNNLEELFMLMHFLEGESVSDFVQLSIRICSFKIENLKVAYCFVYCYVVWKHN